MVLDFLSEEMDPRISRVERGWDMKNSLKVMLEFDWAKETPIIGIMEKFESMNALLRHLCHMPFSISYCFVLRMDVRLWICVQWRNFSKWLPWLNPRN